MYNLSNIPSFNPVKVALSPVESSSQWMVLHLYFLVVPTAKHLPFLLKKQPTKSNTLDKALLYFTVAVNERPGCCNFSFYGYKDTSLLH